MLTAWWEWGNQLTSSSVAVLGTDPTKSLAKFPLSKWSAMRGRTKNQIWILGEEYAGSKSTNLTPEKKEH